MPSTTVRLDFFQAGGCDYDSLEGMLSMFFGQDVPTLYCRFLAGEGFTVTANHEAAVDQNHKWVCHEGNPAHSVAETIKAVYMKMSRGDRAPLNASVPCRFGGGGLNGWHATQVFNVVGGVLGLRIVPA